MAAGFGTLASYFEDVGEEASSDIDESAPLLSAFMTYKKMLTAASVDAEEHSDSEQVGAVVAPGDEYGETKQKLYQHVIGEQKL